MLGAKLNSFIRTLSPLFQFDLTRDSKQLHQDRPHSSLARASLFQRQPAPLPSSSAISSQGRWELTLRVFLDSLSTGFSSGLDSQNST